MDFVNSALTPLKPTLRMVTRNLPKPVDDFTRSLIGDKCTKSLVHNLEFSSRNTPCLTLALSKALGVIVIASSAVVKVPQLLKLLDSRSAEGVSFLSYLLETASFTITLAYSVRSGFPFSTFGETALVALQDVAIALLILVFSGKATWGGSFLVAAASIVYALFTPKIVPMEQLAYLQAGAGVLGVVSKVPQILTIWSEGGTGQLSAFAVFSYLAGSIARIFTTLQEVDDNLILYGYLASFALNLVIAVQMVVYWGSSGSQAAAKTSQQAKVQSTPTTTAAHVASTSGAAPKSSGPKRRG